MEIIEIKLEDQLTSSVFDPSPHRLNPDSLAVSERQVPISYKCSTCAKIINFKTSSFEKHTDSSFSNLKPDDDYKFNQYIKSHDLVNFSFLDFYCPKCSQATKILFEGGPSGYWGLFEFEIKAILLLKESK